MKKNVGTIDKVVRILIAILIVVLFMAHIISGVAGIVLLVLAGILVLTSIISFCPIYFPFKLSTTAKKE
jgi:hypothetical protein